ncbi:unnamed protein product [Urochloa humidicola]
MCPQKLSNLVSPSKNATGGTSLMLSCLDVDLEADLTHVEAMSPVTPPEQCSSRISPSIGPWSKALLDQVAAGKVPEKITGNDARRSLRQLNQMKGFKKATCADKYCLGCSMRPPIIPASMIKNLGESFCKVDSSKLTEENLLKKKKVTAPVERRQLKKKQTKDGDDVDTAKQAKKKPKK